MSWFSIGYFFATTITTGFLIDLFVKDWRADWLEKLMMRFGVGLAAFSVIGVIFNLLHIPLDFRIFLATGLLICIAACFRKRRSSTEESEIFGPAFSRCWKQRSFWYGLTVMVLLIVTLTMYLTGTFAYSYFEDTDPWGYAAVADFIGEHKTFTAPYYSIQYGEPYTQGYQIVMGVLSQTNDSIYWTMKFFSALVISFSIPFMFYFTRRFSQNDEMALLASIFLFSVPAWVSHFIFSLHFNMTIFVVLLYVLAQMIPNGKITSNEKPGWAWVGIIVYASMLINHFSTVFHASVFCVGYLLSRILAEKQIDWKALMVFFGGGLLSLTFFIPAYARHWWVVDSNQQLGGVRTLYPLLRFLVSPAGLALLAGLLATMLIAYRFRRRWQPKFEKWLATGNRGMLVWLAGLTLVLVVMLLPIEIVRSLGTGDRAYLLSDFFSASEDNLINNPTGLGPVLMIALIISFLWASVRIAKLFKSDRSWEAVAYAWIITGFLLVLGNYLSIAIAPFRAWTFLGLVASLFAAWGLISVIQTYSRSSWLPVGAVLLLTVLLIPTTYVPKYKINTMLWPDHTIGPPESQDFYAWMRDGGLPKNSVVANLCGNSEFLSGYDMNPPLWNEVFHPRRDRKPYFVNRPFELDAEALGMLKDAGVEYLTFGATCIWQAPVPAERIEAYGSYIGGIMDRYMKDPRLSVIRNNGFEILLRLK